MLINSTAAFVIAMHLPGEDRMSMRVKGATLCRWLTIPGGSGVEKNLN